MLQKINDFFRTDIVKVFSLNGLSTLIKILTGFVGIKVIALLAGPDGIGLLGQFTNFSAIILALATAGIMTGVTKYVAEYAGSEDKIKSLVQTSVYIIVLSSIACGLLVIAGAAFFSEFIFKSGQFASIFVVFGCTLGLYVLNTLILAILNGFGEFKKYVTVNIASSVTGLLLVIVLAYFFNIYGVLLSIVILQPVIFFFALFLMSRSDWFRWEFFRGKFFKPDAVKLGKFSLMALAIGVVEPAGQLLLRSYLTEKTSLPEAGLWEAMNRISGMYLMIIQTSLSLYYLPKLSQIDNETDLKNEVFGAFKLIIPPLLILIIVLFFAKNFVINLLLDEKFQPMQNLFAFQLIGDFFKVCSWLLAYQMLAKAMTRTFITTEILFSLTFVLLGVIFIPLYGSVGAVMGYAVNCLLYLGAMMYIFRKILLR